jgi:mannose-1-phosphate guanylyltransferase
VDNSVIFEYSRLGEGVCLEEKLVFGRYCVDKAGTSIDLQAMALDWLIADSRQTNVDRQPEPWMDLLNNKT